MGNALWLLVQLSGLALIGFGLHQIYPPLTYLYSGVLVTIVGRTMVVDPTPPPPESDE
jgi:hypothetical protein